MSAPHFELSWYQELKSQPELALLGLLQWQLQLELGQSEPQQLEPK